MRVKSALERSIYGAKFGAFVTPIAWLMFARWPSWWLGAIAGICSFTLLGELANILWIRRAAKRDPSYLDEKID